MSSRCYTGCRTNNGNNACCRVTTATPKLDFCTAVRACVPGGAQGAIGAQGSQGSGSQGAPGTPGANGAQGAAGDTGAQGLTGAQGDAAVGGAGATMDFGAFMDAVMQAGDTRTLIPLGHTTPTDTFRTIALATPETLDQSDIVAGFSLPSVAVTFDAPTLTISLDPSTQVPQIGVMLTATLYYVTKTFAVGDGFRFNAAVSTGVTASTTVANQGGVPPVHRWQSTNGAGSFTVPANAHVFAVLTSNASTSPLETPPSYVTFSVRVRSS